MDYTKSLQQLGVSETAAELVYDSLIGRKRLPTSEEIIQVQVCYIYEGDEFTPPTVYLWAL